MSPTFCVETWNGRQVINFDLKIIFVYRSWKKNKKNLSSHLARNFVNKKGGGGLMKKKLQSLEGLPMEMDDFNKSFFLLYCINRIVWYTIYTVINKKCLKYLSIDILQKKAIKIFIDLLLIALFQKSHECFKR